MNSNRKIFEYVFLLFSGWRIVLIFITFFGLSTFANITITTGRLAWPNQGLEYWVRWANWDGGHFLGIAEHGYKLQQTVFFPLYPLLINILHNLGIPFLWGGLIISNLSTLIALFFLYKLILLDFDINIAKKALFALLIFPTSFYLVAVYTESLFLALTVASFYCARKDRWLLAWVLAGLACVTRLAGVAVIAGLFIELFFGEKFTLTHLRFAKLKSTRFWYLLIAFIPLILYMYYQYHLFGNPLSFIYSEAAWDRHPSMPWNAPISYLQTIVLHIPIMPGNMARTLTEFLFFVFFSICLFFSFKKLRFSYSIFFLISLMLPLLSGTLVAVQRYGLTIFPIFILIALYKNELVEKIGLVLSLSLMAIFAVQFFNWYWVT